MIDFYVLTSPNVQKIFIMLEELAVPYRPIPVDVWKGEQFKPEFTALNPCQDSRDRRSRRPRRQALHGVPVGRDPDVPRRQVRPLPTHRRARTIRRAPLAYAPALHD